MSPDSDPGTIIELTTLVGHRGAHHCHEVMEKLKGTEQLIVLAEENYKIPLKPKEEVVRRF